MLKKITLVFYFYKRYIIYSLVLNLFLALIKVAFPVSVIAKIGTFSLLIFWIYNTRQREILTFYQNFSVGAVFLFGISLIMDLALLTMVYLIIAYAN